MSVDVWATPEARETAGWETVLPPRGPSRLREDVARFGAVVVGLVLLGAPVGLLWSALAPHYTVVFVNREPTYPDLESSKAFIGVEGTFVAVTLVVGLLTGYAVWRLAHRSGPWTVVALALGGALAAIVAARVGLLPGRADALEALSQRKGSVDVYLGNRDLGLRAPWAAVVWPVAALVAFLFPALVNPEQLD